MPKTHPNDCVMVGAFPPPLGGAAKNNLNIYNELKARGASVEKIDTSVGTISHTRSLSYHFRRVIKNAASLRAIYKNRNARSYYTVPDGGLGAIYTLFQISLAVLLFEKIFIHHRTFKYINKRSPWVSAWNALSRDKASHIFLSPRMQSGFEAIYGKVNGRIASNAYFVSSEAYLDKRDNKSALHSFRIGHLSNLCAEKGFFYVISAFELCIERNYNVDLYLAGPVLEPDVQSELDRITAAYPSRVHYRGKVMGAAKTDFYGEIDLFLFPTQFSQEAQPNVIYEAFAAGVPVATVDRACIREMVGAHDGIVTSSENFADATVNYIKNLSDRNIADIEQQKSQIKNSLHNEIAKSSSAYKTLFGEIMNNQSSAPAS